MDDINKILGVQEVTRWATMVTFDKVAYRQLFQIVTQDGIGKGIRTKSYADTDGAMINALIGRVDKSGNVKVTPTWIDWDQYVFIETERVSELITVGQEL